MPISGMSYDIFLSLARHIHGFNSHRRQDIYLVILKCWQQNTTSIVYRAVPPPYILHTSSIWFKFDLFISAVALKIRSRSPKPYQVFIMPQCYIQENFVPINPLVQEISCTQVLCQSQC